MPNCFKAFSNSSVIWISAVEKPVIPDGWLCNITTHLLPETNKTKDMISILDTIKATKNILIVVKDLTDNVILSTRNIPNVVLLRNDEINTLDIIAADTLVITEDAVKEVEEVLA